MGESDPGLPVPSPPGHYGSPPLPAPHQKSPTQNHPGSPSASSWEQVAQKPTPGPMRGPTNMIPAGQGSASVDKYSDHVSNEMMKNHIPGHAPRGRPTQDQVLMDKDRRHVCPHCYKAFRSRQQLNQHSLVHSGIRKYHCHYCERAFKQLSHLQQHHRIHTGEKPYKCPLDGCDKAFAQMSNLQHHMRQHDKANFGQKQCMCPFCDRGYASEKSLKSHISKMHPDSKMLDMVSPRQLDMMSGQPHPSLMSPGHPHPPLHIPHRHAMAAMHALKSPVPSSVSSPHVSGPLELTVSTVSQHRNSIHGDSGKYPGDAAKFPLGNDMDGKYPMRNDMSGKYPMRGDMDGKYPMRSENDPKGFQMRNDMDGKFPLRSSMDGKFPMRSDLDHMQSNGKYPLQPDDHIHNDGKFHFRHSDDGKYPYRHEDSMHGPDKGFPFRNDSMERKFPYRHENVHDGGKYPFQNHNEKEVGFPFRNDDPLAMKYLHRNGLDRDTDKYPRNMNFDQRYGPNMRDPKQDRGNYDIFSPRFGSPDQNKMDTDNVGKYPIMDKMAVFSNRFAENRDPQPMANRNGINQPDSPKENSNSPVQQNGDQSLNRQRKRKPSNPQHVFSAPALDQFTSFACDEMDDCSALMLDTENNPQYQRKDKPLEISEQN